VVYFIEPTEDNIMRLVNDVKRKLYAQMYINFTSSCDIALLRKFAMELKEVGMSDPTAVSRIVSI